jgi:hypothetical protein
VLSKIVSGGQAGVDRGALDAALAAGFPCGGWSPRGRVAEDGVIDPRYPLLELSHGGYAERTLQNVLDSDGTAIIGFGPLEGGTAATEVFCREHGRPVCLVNGLALSTAEAGQLLWGFVREQDIGVLNVAGPRLSKAPQAHAYTRAAIAALLEFVVASRQGAAPVRDTMNESAPEGARNTGE